MPSPTRRPGREVAYRAIPLVLLMLIVGCTSQPAHSVSSASKGSSGPPAGASTPNETVRVVDVSRTPRQPSSRVTLVDDGSLVERQTDMEPLGPQAFFVAGDVVTVNDYAKNHLVEYRDSKAFRSAPAPSLDCCQDLRVDSDTYWLLEDGHVDSYRWKNSALEPLSRVSLDNSGSAQWEFGKLTRVGSTIVATPMVGQAEVVSGPGPVPPEPTFEIHGNTVDVGASGLVISLIVPDPAEDATRLATDGVDAWYWITTDNALNWGYVYKLSGSGELLASYTLPKPGSVVPARAVLVTDDGRLGRVA